MKTPFYKIKISQQGRPLSYYQGQSEIILGPFKVYRKEIIAYCKHIQKILGKQVKVESERIKMTIKK